ASAATAVADNLIETSPSGERATLRPASTSLTKTKVMGESSPMARTSHFRFQYRRADARRISPIVRLARIGFSGCPDHVVRRTSQVTSARISKTASTTATTVSFGEL